MAASVAVMTLATEAVKAQGAYVNVGVGYGFPLACQTLGTNNSANSVEIVRGSLGKGFNAGAGFGYMFNENIGAELNLNYLIGGKTTLTDNSSTTNEEDVQTTKGSMLRINPAIKVTFGETVKPYAKFGMVIGVAGKITETEEDHSGAPLLPMTTEIKTEYKGGVALGVSGALGLDFMLSDMFGIYAELGAIAQSYAPTKSEIVQADFNGADQLGNMTTRDRETEYSNDLPDDTGNDDNKPNQDLKFYSPFSSWGINVGVHLAFGGN